jgi:hypothetical protein
MGCCHSLWYRAALWGSKALVLASVGGFCGAARMLPQATANGSPAATVSEVAEPDSGFVEGQTQQTRPQTKTPLPEEPRPQQFAKPPVTPAPTAVSQNTTRPVAPIYAKYIPPGWAGAQIDGRDKLILGARDLYSIGNFGDIFASSGWSQLWNGQPNYGTDRGAFGQRLGAAAIRESSEGILTDGVFSVALHQDPRFYALGREYSLGHRALYALTRPLVTRSSNDGHAEPNFALLLGYACAAALTNTYYPQRNRNLRDNMSSYGKSLGGSALGFAVDEFTSPIWAKMRFFRRP